MRAFSELSVACGMADMVTKSGFAGRGRRIPFSSTILRGCATFTREPP